MVTNLHLHIRYSNFFLDAGEDPWTAKRRGRKKRALADKIHNLSELDVRKCLRLSDITQPGPSVPEQVETLSDEEVARAPETGWKVRDHLIRF